MGCALCGPCQLPSLCALTRALRCRRQTTIMAVSYDGGVVLGADSRTSTGAPQDGLVVAVVHPCLSSSTRSPTADACARVSICVHVLV